MERISVVGVMTTAPDQPSGRRLAAFCCYNFWYAILPRRGKSRLYK
jgi:hypothetical protein